MNASDRENFKEEANGLLSSLEDLMLEIERLPDDMELMGRVFGELRSAKGLDGDDLSSFTRKVETVYDKVRNGEIRVIRKLVELILEARDSLRLIIDGQNAQGAALRTAIGALKELILAEAEKGPSPEIRHRLCNSPLPVPMSPGVRSCTVFVSGRQKTSFLQAPASWI